MSGFRSQPGVAGAASVPVTPTGNLAATTTQAGLVELQGDIDTILSCPPCTINPLNFTGGSIMPAVNTTVYTRVTSGSAAACTKIRLYISASSGNICVAVYAAADSPVTQVSTSGSVASPGTGIREITISPAVDIRPGMWIAVAADNTTVSFGRSGAPGLAANAMGTGFQYYQTSTFPAPATAAPTSASFHAGYILIGVP